jgi:hypothetical protein
MPAITNTQAVRFCNEQIRPLADLYAQLYFREKAVAAAWVAQGMGTLIPNTADLVSDGAATDGRAQITGAMVNTFAGLVVTMTGDVEAASNAKLNTLLQIAVNPLR